MIEKKQMHAVNNFVKLYEYYLFFFTITLIMPSTMVKFYVLYLFYSYTFNPNILFIYLIMISFMIYISQILLHYQINELHY